MRPFSYRGQASATNAVRATRVVMYGRSKPDARRKVTLNAPCLTRCRASHLAGARRGSSPWQDLPPAKTCASARPAGAQRRHLQRATHCEKLSAMCYITQERLSQRHTVGLLRRPLGRRLLWDARVVEAPMSYKPTGVALTSLKPCFCNGLENAGRCSHHIAA
jgi:hypothetical protein